jgi:hypothetical protein
LEQAVSLVKNAKAEVRLLADQPRMNFAIVSGLLKNCLANAVAEAPIAAGVVLAVGEDRNKVFGIQHAKIDDPQFGLCFHSGNHVRNGIGIEEIGVIVQADEVIPLRLEHQEVPADDITTVLLMPEQPDVRMMRSNILRRPILRGIVHN